jgi:hypothetical protein
LTNAYIKFFNMKKLFFSSVITLTLLVLTSCSRNGDDTISNTQQVVTSGSWKIMLFTDSGNDETTDFDAYTFTFGSNGTINAVAGGVTKTGAWSTQGSSGKFIIDLGPKTTANQPLGELTDDWKILSASETEIRLGDDNASSQELLVFHKN